jgi:hypothetical protein
MNCRGIDDVNDELYWKDEVCPCPCLCSSLVWFVLSYLVASSACRRIIVVLKLRNRPRRRRAIPITHLPVASKGRGGAGKDKPPKVLIYLSHACRCPACVISISSQQRQPVTHGRRIVREKVPGELARFCM